MGKVKDHPPVKLVMGVTLAPEIELSAIRQKLETDYSAIEQESDIYPFSDFTRYYRREIGENLRKVFLTFKKLIRPELLADIKHATNRAEANYLRENRRMVNLDPGYISEAKLVLATTKNYAHRIYLRDGIYGDVHLSFTQNSFQVQPWTYPDYQQKSVIEFFNLVRQNYLQQISLADQEILP